MAYSSLEFYVFEDPVCDVLQGRLQMRLNRTINRDLPSAIPPVEEHDRALFVYRSSVSRYVVLPTIDAAHQCEQERVCSQVFDRLAFLHKRRRTRLPQPRR